jgi:hypothetical protein
LFRVITTSLVLSFDLLGSSFKGSGEVGLQLSVASVAGNLFLTSGLRSLGLECSLTSNNASSGCLSFSSAERLVCGVQSLHQLVVL